MHLQVPDVPQLTMISQIMHSFFFVWFFPSFFIFFQALISFIFSVISSNFNIYEKISQTYFLRREKYILEVCGVCTEDWPRGALSETRSPRPPSAALRRPHRPHRPRRSRTVSNPHSEPAKATAALLFRKHGARVVNVLLSY